MDRYLLASSQAQSPSQQTDTGLKTQASTASDSEGSSLGERDRQPGNHQATPVILIKY